MAHSHETAKNIGRTDVTFDVLHALLTLNEDSVIRGELPIVKLNSIAGSRLLPMSILMNYSCRFSIFISLLGHFKTAHEVFSIFSHAYSGREVVFNCSKNPYW